MHSWQINPPPLEMANRRAEMTNQHADTVNQHAEMIDQAAEMVAQGVEMVNQYCAFISIVNNAYNNTVIYYICI